MMKTEVTIFWFRRDLRLHDNAGLYHALKAGKPVLPIFIFDTAILNALEDKQDRRVEFIYSTLESLERELNELGCSIKVMYGNVEDVFKQLMEEYLIHSVYCNEDYEPIAIERDANISKLLQQKGRQFFSYKDQVVLAKDEVLKDNHSPYTVFTPYMKKYKTVLNSFFLSSYPVKKYFKNFIQYKCENWPSLHELGFVKGNVEFIPFKLPEKIIANYHEMRDIPAVYGTSRISIHLRFGTVSIREVMKRAMQLNEKWFNELIWREFYMMILYHFPHVTQRAFKPAYDAIPWRNNAHEFDCWCLGNTGYPIVDAGMRELNQTGFMHNRVRMITASFLTKHLLIDWRWGEAYFAKKLMDFELSSNNGGWQWAASSGCDAAPYFRIFNPSEQTKKFDPQLHYIRRWVPDFESFSYPVPIVDHKFARERVLKTYKKALSNVDF